MGSPWGRYKEVLDLENINGSITVAERKAPHYGLVAIKVFPSTAAEKVLERHQRVKHENIVDVLDAFTTDTSLYIVLEHLPISLLQIVEGAKYPTEWQLAAILNQVRLVITGAVHSLTRSTQGHLRPSLSRTREVPTWISPLLDYPPQRPGQNQNWLVDHVPGSASTNETSQPAML